MEKLDNLENKNDGAPVNDQTSSAVAPSADPTPPAAGPGKPWPWKRFVIGLAAFGMVTLVVMGIGVYFGYTIIRKAVQSTSLEIPTFRNEVVTNQIAYIGSDFNLWLVAPDGSDRRRLTDDGKSYRFPTWAPDGRQLAFIGRNDKNDSVLYVSPTSRSEPTVVYDDPDAAPFYLYWSPDSRAVTFLTQGATDMAMRLVEPATPEIPRVIATGAPFYWAWSPQSDKMLLHVNGSRSRSSDAHISLHENREEATRVELDLAPGKFQAPLWSSDGQTFFYIAENDNGAESIFRTDSQTLEEVEVTDLTGHTQMVLSPENQNLALLQYEAGTRPPFGRAYLVNVETSVKRRLTDSLVASMYWSPDGKKLAILSLSRPNDSPTASGGKLAAPLRQQVTLRWWIYNLETETLDPLISFKPTISFLQTVPYFDQYHLSLTFWSPDSRYLVITKQEEDQPSSGTVWVVDTTDQAEPLKVGDGSLAVWSWH